MIKQTALRTVSSLALAFGLFSAANAQDMPGEGVTVNPGVATWESARPLESIFAQLLGDLGYEVEDAKSLANPIFYQSVTVGDIDFWANGWFPLHNTQLPDNFDETASRVGTIIKQGALEGYLVDKASADKFNITSLEDFKRPEVQEAFDADGDGLADLVACPPGWGCEVGIDHHLEVYGLRDHINPIKATYAASFADALARYRNGEPIFYYTWTPNFTGFLLEPGTDVEWINVPEIIPSESQAGLEDSMVVSGLEGAVSDPLKIGFPANDIQVVANNEFLSANPAAAKLFELVSVPLEDVAEMTARINDGEDSDEDIQAMVEGWLSDHQSEVDGWLEEARAAAS